MQRPQRRCAAAITNQIADVDGDFAVEVGQVLRDGGTMGGG